MMHSLFAPIPLPDQTFLTQGLEHQTQLTKPPGSLGRLEALAARVCSMQSSNQPNLRNIHVSIFAADHGIADEGVSAFPQVVTQEMVKNFGAGGAAVNVLSRECQATFEVIDVGLIQAVESSNVLRKRAGHGTANFRLLPAMTAAQLCIALEAGKEAVERAISHQSDLFIGGEMGIANTTSASAMAIAMLNLSVLDLTGAGTGLNAHQIGHKASVIEAGLALHAEAMTTPLEIVRHLGGFEIAALTSAYIHAAQARLPVMIDGFISSVAALMAVQINADCADWFFYGHRSAEKGHTLVLEALQAEPILDLNMRLGEASGALMAVPILQRACRLHNEMATFAQAHITTGG